MKLLKFPLSDFMLLTMLLILISGQLFYPNILNFMPSINIKINFNSETKIFIMEHLKECNDTKVRLKIYILVFFNVAQKH